MSKQEISIFSRDFSNELLLFCVCISRDDFSVQAKPDPSNVAYLSGPLQLHADLPYYEYKPGVSPRNQYILLQMVKRLTPRTP